MSGWPPKGVDWFYSDESCAIANGDCRDVLPLLPPVDVVISDPVYPRLDYGWSFISPADFNFSCRQFWFWMTKEPFPLTPTALHVWSKSNVYIGDHEQWELIYEVNGKRVDSVLRFAAVNCEMNAQMNGDKFYQHPCQKPIKLMTRLVRRTEGLILDPFMGSGTTLRAAKDQGRRAIGIEINPDYCAIAVKRLQQAVLPFADPLPQQVTANLYEESA